MELDFITSNWHLFLALFAITFMLAFDPSRRGSAGVKRISAVQLPQLISHDSAVVVDVCESDEFNSGHIQKAINLPLSSFKDQVGKITKYQNKPLVLTCHSGNRAGRAATILKKNEFSDLYILTGGMNSWKKENLPVVKN